MEEELPRPALPLKEDGGPPARPAAVGVSRRPTPAARPPRRPHTGSSRLLASALRPLVGKLGRPLTALPHAPKGGPLLRGIRLHNLDRTSWQTTSLCPSCTAE